MKTLYDLAEGIRRCTSCPLWEGRTLAVPGEGSGKVMFIGDVPEAEENRMGRPFVGPSGEIFDEMLEIVHLTRETCFVTNACKCHPVHGHKPNLEELKTCKEEWLDEHIGIIKPKLIILMGDLSLKLMFGGGDFSKLRGKVIDQKFFVTHCPHEAYKHPNSKKQMKKDFEKLDLFLRKIKV